MSTGTSRVALGAAALVATSLLWGSSFPAIKVVVESIGGSNYVWMRAAIALAVLAPIVVLDAARGRLIRASIVGGLAAGIAYTLGLWFQGVGTGLTTASNSAFITGLNVVIVHFYSATVLRSYTGSLLASLLLSLAGLWLLTRPAGGPNVGDILVLIGSFFWAAQVVIVSKYSSSANPLHFTFFQIAPSTLLALASIPQVLAGNPPKMDLRTGLVLAYLGIACTVIAFALQVYGQRYISPASAATIFLLEPPAAAILSMLLLGERMEFIQMVGGALILMSMYIAVREEFRARGTHAK
ncbi:MAG: DMT family transporter [Aeropyrum sp.]|nr:DMT family transporter [Aeropyrum sp.]MCE4616654.1 DMT family transporter [Aeropyrum sp.]